MQKNIEKWKENKLNDSIIVKQSKSVRINVAVLSTWTLLVLAVVVFSHLRRSDNVDNLALIGAEAIADRYILSQEAHIIFKDIFFDSATLPFAHSDFSQEQTESFLEETFPQEQFSSTRLSPIINEIYGNKGVYINFVGNKLAKDETKPDLWTTTALQELERGKEYVYERAVLHNAPYLRVLFPARIIQRHKDLKAKQSIPQFFLKNQVGTMYSGVLVYYPLTEIIERQSTTYYLLLAALFVLWLFGAVCCFVFGGRFINLISQYATLKHRLSLINSESKSEINTYQRDLKRIESEKEDALKDRSQFFAKVSHEIRTPLNGILGMSELLLRTKLTDEQSFQVASLRASANNLLDVFNDIWDYSRMETGNLQVDSQPFALRDTLYSVVKIYSHQANSKGLELIANIAPNIPDNLLGDPTRIRQVLSNLLSNAIKFTDRGEIVLSVSESSFVDDVAKINFMVRDTGIGLSSEKRLAIISSEQMHDGSSKRKYEGLGLGLAISSRLITLMGGKLNVDSEVGKGSSFSFSLNLPYLPGVANENINTAQVLSGEHVLIVDDNATNRRILREQVKEWGMVPSDCTGVDEALRLLQVSTNSYTPFSVVISDLQMPEKDGIDLVQEMKKTQALANIPVILLSSAILGTDMAKDLFFASLYKPAKPSELIKALAAAVNHKTHFNKDSTPEILQDEKHVMSEHSFKILLVEDLEINKLVVSSILRELGHEAAVAKDGQEALDVLEQDDFDLVLMDINMPVMDGIQAVKIIREREQSNNKSYMPVIALTANADGDARAVFMKAGFDSYILKPAALQDLHYEIERMAEKFNIQSRGKLNKKDNFMSKQQVPSVFGTSALSKSDKSPSVIVDSLLNTSASASEEVFSFAQAVPFALDNLDMQAKPLEIERIEPIDFSQNQVKNTSFEPSIFSQNKTMPPVKNENKHEPSIAKKLLPTTQKPLKLDLAALTKNPPEEKITVDESIDINKFAPSIKIDKEKFVPKKLINTEIVSKVESLESVEDKSTFAQTEKRDQENTSIKKEQENMDSNSQNTATHFSNGKERKVLFPIDVELLTKSFASYPDLAYRSIEIFLRDAPKSLVEIKNAIEIDDNSTLTVSAHAVKGLISYYSKGEAYEAAMKLEHMGRDKFLPAQKGEVLSTVGELEIIFEQLLDAMKIYME